jgi:hypothetical protein
MAKQPETLLKDKFRRRLDQLPLSYVEKIQQMAIVGTPDFLMCVAGYFIACELKGPDGRLSALQQHKLAKIEKAGGIAIEVTPENWLNVIIFLENLTRKPRELPTDVQTHLRELTKSNVRPLTRETRELSGICFAKGRVRYRKDSKKS